MRDFEFSSIRKMMSTVVQRESDGKLMCYTKGADSQVYECILNKGDNEKKLLTQLGNCAIAGLRTLMFASRVVDKNEIEGHCDDLRS